MADVFPVRHYRAWQEKAGIEKGSVFRKLTPQERLTDNPLSAQGVAPVVKAAARSAGHPEALFSDHSLRAGFLTEAGRQLPICSKCVSIVGTLRLAWSPNMCAIISAAGNMPAWDFSESAAFAKRKRRTR